MSTMSKRSLSPQQLPPPKRPHVAQCRPLTKMFSFDNSLYDELILTIFSYLSWFDLCTAQLINKNWARLAVDNELWRKQYIQVFGRPRLRGARGYLGRPDGREIKPLPARAHPNNDYKDWKWMFRISSNWRKGRCSVANLNLASPSPSSEFEDGHHTHLVLTGALTITASSCPSYTPTICVTGPTSSFAASCKPNQDVCCSITALTIDQSPPLSNESRLLVFLSTGEFIGYQLKQHGSIASSPTLRYSPTRRIQYVRQAAYHHPLLVTLSRDFAISLYNLDGSINLTQTLSSYTTFPPASLVLSTPSSTTYKLVLAYAIPVFPSHWTAGATELIISGPRMVITSTADSTSPDSYPFDETARQIEQLTVISTRTARAIDVPFGWIDDERLRAMRAQWGRKVVGVADIQTDGKWLILAPGNQIRSFERFEMPEYTSNLSDNASSGSTAATSNDTSMANRNAFTASWLHSPTSLQLYRLILPPRNSIASSPPKLNFVRTLHGQTGPITALSLSDGRCVSLSRNGSIWVWDLEAGTGAEVAAANLESIRDLALGPDAEPIRGSVAFDERRLIVTQGDSVVLRRFDV